MKKFIKMGTALVAAAFLLTGCGDEMAVLTESEEAVIVNYSAGTLAKHNSRSVSTSRRNPSVRDRRS